MPLIAQCIRCQKQHQLKPSLNQAGLSNFIQILETASAPMPENWINAGGADLCPHCKEALIEWLKPLPEPAQEKPDPYWEVARDFDLTADQVKRAVAQYVDDNQVPTAKQKAYK